MSQMEIGVIVRLRDEPEPEIRKVADLNLHSCQICSWDPTVWTQTTGEKLAAALQQHGVKVSSFWAGYTGPMAWNFLEGPGTIGVVPPRYRAERVACLKKAADCAVEWGIGSVTTHAGFIPEDPNDPLYDGTVAALKEIALHCQNLGLEFRFETGQETPVTLLRAIERIGTDNLGINLDPANLILYGKGNPVDALDVFGQYVRELHAKDGLYPTNGSDLGRETPLGEGKVNFPALITGLKERNFSGALTIEREIKEGVQQIADIRRGIELLRSLI